MDYLTGLRGSFWRKLLFAGVLVALADLLLFESNGGSVVGAFLLAWAGFSFAAHRQGWHKVASCVAMAASFCFAAAMFYDPSLLALLLFLGALAMTVLLPQIMGSGDGWFWLKRLIFHGLGTPFGPLLDLNRVAKAKRRSGSGFSLSRTLPNLVLPLFGTALFLGLFSMANPIISDFLSKLHVGGIEGDDIARLFFWGLAFVAMWSTLRPRRTKYLFARLVDSEPGDIPGVTIASVTMSLTLFNLLFAMQNAMDLIFIWGGARLPDAFTLAEYAHRGAYPLIVTALLAGLFVLVTTHPKSAMAGNRLIRILIILWIAQNIFLVASTAERTWLYIESYSLTRLRIAALLWMALVATGLILVTWRMLRGNSLAWLVNGNVLAALGILSICTVVDLGEVAARWNVHHAREAGGKGVHLDLCYLNNRGGSSLLALASLEQRRDLEPDFKQRVTLVRQQVEERIETRQHIKGGWRWRDGRRLSALPGFALKNLKIPNGYFVTCNGQLMPIGERYADEVDYERT